MRCTVQDRMLTGPWVKHSGMNPRPMAQFRTKGLEPWATL